MKHLTSEELHIVVHHFPLQVVAAGSPVVMIDGLVAVDSDKVLGRIASQLAVEIGGGDDSLLVFGKASCCLFDDAESHRHDIVEGFFVDVKRLFVEFVNLIEDGLALVERGIFNSSLELGYFFFLFVSRILYVLLDLFCLST